jgi:hypothetical protein
LGARPPGIRLAMFRPWCRSSSKLALRRTPWPAHCSPGLRFHSKVVFPLSGFAPVPSSSICSRKRASDTWPLGSLVPWLCPNQRGGLSTPPSLHLALYGFLRRELTTASLSLRRPIATILTRRPLVNGRGEISKPPPFA